jgi:hypothetical protein
MKTLDIYNQNKKTHKMHLQDHFIEITYELYKKNGEYKFINSITFQHMQLVGRSTGNIFLKIVLAVFNTIWLLYNISRFGNPAFRFKVFIKNGILFYFKTLFSSRLF